MKIHPQFKLNGSSYTHQELLSLSKRYSTSTTAFKRPIGKFLIDWLDNSKTVLVNTSGSTGKPKQIQLQKSYMVNSALATGSFFNLKAGDSALLCLPSGFIAGKMMLVRAMVLGLELDYVVPTSSPLDKNSKNYDFAAMVPLQAKNSIKKLMTIDKLIIGGAPINTELENKLKELKTSVFETYGMTETITHIAVKKLGDSYFKTLPDITLKKDDRDCLIIHAPKINKEEVVTNDIVDVISSKEFKWLGRYDSIINSGGIKLIPEQIEAKLASVVENRFFIAGIKDKTLGQKLVLIVEGSSDSKSILEKIKENMALEGYEIPKVVFSLPQFSTTSNGKIKRKETLKLLNS